MNKSKPKVWAFIGWGNNYENVPFFSRFYGYWPTSTCSWSSTCLELSLFHSFLLSLLLNFIKSFQLPGSTDLTLAFDDQFFLIWFYSIIKNWFLKRILKNHCHLCLNQSCEGILSGMESYPNYELRTYLSYASCECCAFSQTSCGRKVSTAWIKRGTPRWNNQILPFKPGHYLE